ncbi:MAG: hypothetical protein Q8862_07320 [Bacteroidota bacterium]|nr:hypothetical protein [Bacteroidota bacterium]
MKIKFEDRYKDLNFDERMSSLSDEELNNVLKHRKDYQEKAVDSAVNEALKRGIIASVGDLNKPEYNFEETAGNSFFFPLFNNVASAKTMLASLTRTLILLGSIPIIFSIFKSINQITPMVILSFAVGVMWCLLAIFMRIYKRRVIPVVLSILYVIVYPSAMFLFARSSTPFEWGLIVFMFVFGLYLLWVSFTTLKYLNQHE